MATTKTFLMTGATGFLGRHVLETLATDASVRTVALVRDRRAWDSLEWTDALRNVEVLEADVTDEVSVAALLEQQGVANVDGIFHFAAKVEHSRKDPRPMYDVNVGGTLAMVALASQLRARMVYVSTSGVVGCFSSPRQWADEHSTYKERTVRRWPYYHSKLEAETQAREMARQEGVELVVVRPPVLLGPGDHRFRSTSNVIKMLRKKLPFLIRGGIHFVDVRDASAALVAAMQHPTPREIYHLEGTACDLEEFFGMVRDVSGVEPPSRILPARVAHMVASTNATVGRMLPGAALSLPDPVVIEMATRYWGLRSRYANGDLGYESRAPMQTLADTVTWLRKNHPQLSDN